MRIAAHCGSTLAIIACLAGFAVADPPESNDGNKVPNHNLGRRDRNEVSNQPTG